MNDTRSKHCSNTILLYVSTLLLLLCVISFATEPLRAQTTWEPASNGMEGGWLQSWVFTDNGNIIASIGNGVYTLNEDHRSWRLIQQGGMALGLANNGVLLGGTNEKTIVRSEDGGVTWQQVLASTTFIGQFYVAPDKDIWTVSGTALHHSEDNGKTWTILTLPDSLNSCRLAFDRNGRMLGVSGYGVFRSTDKAKTWTRIASDGNIGPIVITSNGDLLATTYGYPVRSTDDGETWNVRDSIPARKFAVAPNGDIYAGVYNHAQGDPSYPLRSGIYRSTDDGTNWSLKKELNPGALGVATDGTVWATAGNRIFSSNDNGEHWQEIIKDLHANYVSTVAVDTAGILYTIELFGNRVRINQGRFIRSLKFLRQ